MVNKDKLMDRIINTDLEKVTGPKDNWEKYIDLDDGRVLIVGYEEEGKVCEGFNDTSNAYDEVKCAISYRWYWEIRDSKTWEVSYENRDTDLGFCSEELNESWSDEGTFEEAGDVPGTELCTWSNQDSIEDIAEDIFDDIKDELE